MFSATGKFPFHSTIPARAQFLLACVADSLNHWYTGIFVTRPVATQAKFLRAWKSKLNMADSQASQYQLISVIVMFSI